MNLNSKNSRDQRLHHSLPALDIESAPEISHSEPGAKRRKNQHRGDEVLTYIISAFYAKILVILGIALPITDAIATSDYDTYEGYYMYLYVGSIVFLLYMYVIQMKEKSLQENSRIFLHHQRHSNDSTESLGGVVSKKGQYIRYGSFYFRMGVTGFGIGSVIYSCLQFGQYFELSSDKNCSNVLKAIKPILRIVFALMQMLFIFSHSNFLHLQRTKIIARFGLMHLIGTNLCEWLFVLVQETQYDIYKSALSLPVNVQFLQSKTFQVTQALYQHKFTCLRSNIMEPILVKLEKYLAPCTVEYSLLCSVILVLMWRNNCGHNETQEAPRSPALDPPKKKESGCNVIYSRSQSQFSVDCAQAHKGLFSGILILAATVVSLIMFFELVSYKNHEDAAILQVNVWEAVMFWTGTVAVLLCMWALRNVGFRRMKRRLELEHLLLLVTQCGIFIYFLFQIIGVFLMGRTREIGEIMRIITPVSALVQSSCQTVLVLDAWRRRCSTMQQMRQKPGRQLITFLLVINIALWAVNRLKNNQSVSHPKQMDFYGVLAWNIITHVSMPLIVSYRFQSTVCFYEIWKHVYKMRPINREFNDDGNDLCL